MVSETVLRREEMIADLQMTDGLSLTIDDHHVRLKWHRLRRDARDAEFDPRNLALGLRLGASMEVDLQARRDGGFAVLHDADLSGETTGFGPVAAATAADLAGLRLRRLDRSPMTSESLAASVTAAHPDALLQLDMKNDRAGITDRHIAHFAAEFGAIAAHIIVSGGSEPLIAELAAALPGLRKGFDPTDALLDAGSPAAMERRLLASLRDPARPDMVYLNWELVVEAAAKGLDMVALTHSEGVAVDAWTHALRDPAAGFTDDEWQVFAALLALKPDQITTDSPLATEAAVAARLRR